MYEMVELGTLISQAKTVRCGDAEYPILSMTMRDGLVFQDNKFKKIVASKDKSDYKVVYRNQLVISFPIDEGVLAAQRIADAGIVSPAYGVWNIDQEKIQPEYLEYALRCNRAIGYYKANLRGSTARRRSLPTPTLLAFTVPLPTIAEQNRIINIIHEAKNILDNRKEMLSKLDELIRARFVEMFGDMLLNTKKWPEIRLDSIADIVSGITKGRKVNADEFCEVPYMAVSNVKDGYIDWSTVKTIKATAAEIEQYRLKSMDVLMTEGGDPDKVGRGAIIHEPPENCIHQNHIFRVRLDQNIILPEYMEEYLQHQRAKRYFLGCAKQTTGIASINKKQLTALPVLVPPIELQKEFAIFVIQIGKSKLVEATTIIPKGGFLQWR
jgi:type I restriction enzyme S subunit